MIVATGARRAPAAAHGAPRRRTDRRLGCHPRSRRRQRSGARGRLGRWLDRPRRSRDARRGGRARVARGRRAARGRDRPPVPARLLPRAARAPRRHDPASPRARRDRRRALHCARSGRTRPSRCRTACARSSSRSAASPSTRSCTQLGERGIACTPVGDCRGARSLEEAILEGTAAGEQPPVDRQTYLRVSKQELRRAERLAGAELGRVRELAHELGHVAIGVVGAHHARRAVAPRDRALDLGQRVGAAQLAREGRQPLDAAAGELRGRQARARSPARSISSASRP